jgi:prephenate dehydratase
VLQVFADQDINMSKIQSMPVLGKRNEYNFYVDIEWDNNKQYDTAIRQVLKYTHNFNILGEYPRHEDEGMQNEREQKFRAQEKITRKYISVKKVVK